MYKIELEEHFLFFSPTIPTPLSQTKKKKKTTEL